MKLSQQILLTIFSLTASLITTEKTVRAHEVESHTEEKNIPDRPGENSSRREETNLNLEVSISDAAREWSRKVNALQTHNLQ